jgi:cytochrome b pre-mRNA-processing protein 3
MLQALVNFFFQDIEDRLRALLGPRTSERTIISYMKEYRELWNGSQLSLDIGLVGGDWELAGAIWRNIFAAKGWDLNGKGGELGDAIDPASAPASLKESPLTQTLDANATAEGTSPAEVPYHIYYFVAYLRRELKRLEAVPDEDIIQTGSIGIWGSMDGLGSGDEVPETKLTPKEIETWEKMSEEAGTYR